MSSSTMKELDITIISAKHLKNVNWRNGDLKPYTTFNLNNSDPRLATHADDSCSTSPVWNERFTLPLTLPIPDSVLTIEIYHSKPSETPKPLVGAVKFPLTRLELEDSPPNKVYNLDVIRPSGRPQGKVRVRLELRERPLPPPIYHAAPSYSHYYPHAPPPPPAPHPREYIEFPPSPFAYNNLHSYYSGYYPPQSPLPPPPFTLASPSYGLPSGPSAPVGSPLPYDQKPSMPKLPSYGGHSGPYSHVRGSSELNGAMGGLNLEELNGYEKERASAAERESLASPSYGLPSWPSAPVGSPSPYDQKPSPPLTSMPKLPSYGGPSGPSAPVDHSYVRGSGGSELNGAMGWLNLEELSGYEKERASAAERESLGYRDYKREY